jgi:type IX secretion system PorP/SprF family membrane protein
MKKTLYFIIACLSSFTTTLQAQQLYQFSQYMVRPVLFNPAAAGYNEAVCIYGAGRNQWMGYQDQAGEKVNPVDYIAGTTAPLYAINSGIGFQFNSGKLGYQSRTDFRLDYAYKIEIKEEQMLSVGVYGQLSMINLDLDKLVPLDVTDPLLLKPGKQMDMIPEAGFGVFYSSSNRWFAGLSLMNLLGSKAILGNLEINDQMTFVAQGQYKFKVIDERFKKFDLAPSFLVKSNFTSTQVELDMLGYLNDKFWFGTGYRLQDGVKLLGGAQIADFAIGLSYDVTTGKVNEATKSGSAELHLSYCLPVFPKVKRESGFNTRHL